jgi:hypothetical protein
MYPCVVLLTDIYFNSLPGVLEAGKSCFNGKSILHRRNIGSNSDLSVKYVIAKIQILLIMETTTLSIFIESAGDRAPASAVVPPTIDCNHTMKVRQGISTLPYLQRILTYKIFST